MHRACAGCPVPYRGPMHPARPLLVAVGIALAASLSPAAVPALSPAAVPVAAPAVRPAAPSAATSTATPTAEPAPAREAAGPAPAVLDPVSLVGAGNTGRELSPAAVTRALRPLLRGGALGSGSTPARVVDVASGEVLHDGPDTATTPASTLKLVTAASVLDALGPDAVLRTRTVLRGADDEVPTVVVVGAGDPSLRSSGSTVGGTGTRLRVASMRTLAARTADALREAGITKVRVAYDATLFSGPAVHPSWSRTFPAAGIVAPVSALVVDQGRRTPRSVDRVADPAAAAARVLAAELRDAGIAVRGTARKGRDAPSALDLAAVASPTVGDLVERMLATSDNDYAEALARLGAIAAGHPGSFTGVAQRGRDVLAQLDVSRSGARVVDGSGLSRRDRLSPRTLTDLLVRAAGHGAIASGLPVSAATGSLRGRYRLPAQERARGVVRAKTGTLTGVAGLAGYVSRPDGRLLAFAMLDGAAPGGTLAARAQLDRAVTTLVTCRCEKQQPEQPTQQPEQPTR